MEILLWILLSTFVVSLLSFIGVFTLSLSDKLLQKLLLMFVALSAGASMGGAFLHLIPEAMENSGEVTFLFVLIGFAAFFLFEKVLNWRHCHKQDCDVHSFAYINLLGDGFHNFIDGLIIAASFLVDIELGIVTTIAIALHEIPQEIGDFGVLIYGGFKKVKALFYNFLTAVTAVIGGLAGYFLSSIFTKSMFLVIPFAAGGFIYIASSDLIPELRKEKNIKKAMLNFIVFIIGVLLMYCIRFLE